MSTGENKKKLVAIGDSVMWGQGLADNHKFVNLVRDWLSTNLPIQSSGIRMTVGE